MEALFGLLLFIGIVAGIVYATRGKPGRRRRKDVQGWAEAQRDEWR